MKKVKHRPLAVSLLLAALFLPLAIVTLAPIALGQPAKTSVEEARHRMEKGQTLFAQGKYGEAVSEFEAAHEAQPYSAFLYNAAVAAERAGDPKRAALHYTEFLAAEPTAPDAADIKANIARLNAEIEALADAGPVDVDGGDGGPPPPVVAAPSTNTMRSLVLIESEPAGAPFTIYQRVTPTAPAFSAGGANPGWKAIASNIKTPKDLSLNIGKYHVVIDAFQDYHRSETDIDLDPGHVYNFKANLSQGKFVGFLKVSSRVEGAKIFLDDPPPHKKAPWARTPGGGLVEDGEHTLWVEAPGYTTLTKKFSIEHGQTLDVPADIERVDYGFLKLDGNAEEVEVKIDGAESGVYKLGTGPVKVKLSAGPHAVVLDASGRKKWKGEVVVPRGQELGVHGTLIDTYPRGKAVVAGVFAVGAEVGGFVFLDQSNKLPDTDSKKNLFKGFAYGGFIGGGVLAAASVFLFVYDPNPDSLVKLDKANEFPEESSALLSPKIKRVTPMVGSNGGALFVSGSF